MTICPPRDSNTALYHDLVKAGNITLSDLDRATLRESARKIILEASHREYVKKMVAMSNLGNMDQVFQGYQSLPKAHKLNSFEIKMWNLNGTITSPYYGEAFVNDFYKEDKEVHLILELPKYIGELIGYGSLHIELEVNTREELDEVFFSPLRKEQSASAEKIYTFHKTEMKWTEAEAECQKSGGHLASVTSKEVNEVLERLAKPQAGIPQQVWLGGKKGFGNWTWSDGSPWGEFTKWSPGWEWAGDGACVGLDFDPFKQQTTWKDLDGKYDKNSFICQVDYTSLNRTTNNLQLTFKRDQLNVTSFHVWYKAKGASQQLLNKWQDKKMTGFKLSWRIENPPLIANISEVGRSIKTPGLGGPFDEGAAYSTSEQVFLAVLNLPNDIKEKMESGTLEIGLDVVMRQANGWSDQVFAFSSFKLHRRAKKWLQAEAVCKSEGGKLASIHSDWEQMLAEKAALGGWAWLGGRNLWKDGQGQWADNSTWLYTRWDGGKIQYDNLALNPQGFWKDSSVTSSFSFLCQAETVIVKESSLKRLRFNQKQLAFFPFYVLFLGQKSNQGLSRSSGDLVKNIPGFALSWSLKDSNGSQLTEELPAKDEVWKQDEQIPKYKSSSLSGMIRLAQHLRIKENMTHEQILAKVIQGQIQNINSTSCVQNENNPDPVYETLPDLLSNIKEQDLQETVLQNLTEEDVLAGFELYHAAVYCPSALSTDLKLFNFVDKLLAHETPRTIMRTFVNLFHSGVVNRIAKTTPIKKLYDILAAKFNLQYGNVLIATASKAQLQTVIDMDWPFFTNNTGLVRRCLVDSDCDQVQAIVQRLGNKIFGNVSF